MPKDPRPALPRRRWGIGVLLGSGVLVSFLDRVSLSAAAPQLARELSLGPAELGILFSSFLWCYALMQVPVGIVVDRLGVTRVGRWGAFLWSVAAMATAFAGGFGGILAARIVLGIAEAPSFPAVSKATGHWFPRRERARATAIFDASAKFSNVIGIPLIAFVVVRFGWRWGFGLTSAISFAYFVAFYLLYREPSSDGRLSQQERGYILSGGSVPEGQSESGTLKMLSYLLGQPKIWGLAIGFGAYGYSFYLFLTWLPEYLVSTHGMTLLRSAGYTAMPWAFATVTDLAVGGCLAIVGATRTTDPAWATFWISVSLGGLAAAAPVGWSIPSLIGPKGGVGAVGGIMNFAVNVMGIAAPIVTGLIVRQTHSFTGAFLVAAAILLVGAISFTSLLGRIETLPGPAKAEARGAAG